MSSIFANSARWSLVGVIFLAAFASSIIPQTLFAASEDGLSLTLTPPLIQVTQTPGGMWSSNLKVVNTNRFDLTVAATVQDFQPDGETGNPIFSDAPVGSPEDTHRMSGWIIIPTAPITIKAGQTAQIPFSIAVPKQADPGGHYAAILVSTKQEDPTFAGSGAGVSSAISSLLFMRVPGEVIEEGSIRDFYAEDTLVQGPAARFMLRFENKGNVHLIPSGTIEITNMWGKHRGSITVNKTNAFGNVLPGSTRKYEFDWNGEASVFEFGRYTAIATLSFGENGRQNVSRTTYFWVVPWKQVLPIAIGIALFVWFLQWSIRSYVRKAVALERAHLGIEPRSHHHPSTKRGEVTATPITLAMLRRPLVEEEQTAHVAGPKHHKKRTRRSWVARHKAETLFLLVLLFGMTLIGWYFVEVFQEERNFHMEQVRER